MGVRTPRAGQVTGLLLAARITTQVTEMLK